MSRHTPGIRFKLITIFILIKVLPLAALAWFAWVEIAKLTDSVEKQSIRMIAGSHEVVSGISKLSTENSIRALDIKSRESIERLASDTASQVASFLYDRDRDIALAASIPVNEKNYRQFLDSRLRPVIFHAPWKMNDQGTKWEPVADTATNHPSPIKATNKDNSEDFHYRPPDKSSIIKDNPLYLEMTFIDPEGNEIIKTGSSSLLSQQKKNVADPVNTFCRAETYFEQLQQLKPGEIYVSKVIGQYVKGHFVGTYSHENAEKKGVRFAPEESGYAGKENPVGKRFQGIVRWATPVVKDGQIIGYVTLALDHTHIMEFTDHLVPTQERYSAISDAGSGNYAFIWDYEGRNISHPRDYFIVGYNPETGEQEVPWLDNELYPLWQESGMSMDDFEAVAPQFQEQSLQKNPSLPLTKEGYLGLDCRYLNFAPQCTGWFTLTQEGGSGSFLIFWSGLWKLTTAATIPYYTGIYGSSPRGFGFVTIGANVNEFHASAMETTEKIKDIEADFMEKLNEEKLAHIEQIHLTLQETFQNLSFYTLLMIAAVIVVAIFMAGMLTSRILALIDGFRIFRQGDRSHRLPVETSDEMGQLANAYNEMADTIQSHISDIETSKLEMEKVNDELESEIEQRRNAQNELAKHQANLEKTVLDRTSELEKEIVERKKVETSQQRLENRLREQNNASMNLAGNQDLYKGDLALSLDTITTLAAETLDVDRCGIWLFNAENTAAICNKLTINGHLIESDQQFILLENHPQLMTALKQNKTLAANDVFLDKNMVELTRNYFPERDIQSLMLARVSEHGKFTGWISFSQTTGKRTWHVDEVNFAASIADITGLAINAARQHQEIEEKKELTARLRRAEKMEALGTLAGGVAHDLNNILSGIVSYPELLLLKLPEDSQLRQPVTTILNSGRRAAAIVQDLLTMARRGVSNMEVVNLNKVVEDYLTSHEYKELNSYHPTIQVKSRMEPKLMNILGSQVHLSKTLMNLVSNGFEAIPGTGQVTITTENCYIDRPVKGYDVVNEGDYIALTVQDTGTGISTEDFNRIFEPFYTKKKMGRSGTGLGMAVVWGTVKDHQGYIDFDSNEDTGSRFTLYFPVTRKELNDTAPKEVEAYLGNGQSILVVDDVEEQQEIASAILTTLGYTVETVCSGETAIEFLTKKTVDLVILDMIMDPGIDGLDTYKQLIKINPGQKVIIASGFSETERTNEIMRLGASRYLKKPYTVEKIGTSVWSVLNP